MPVYNKDAFQGFIEREGVVDFLMPRSAEDIEGTEITLYELANDRYGVIFQIFPPFYGMDATEKKLESLYKIPLPEHSSLQFFTFASRNIELFKKIFTYVHRSPSETLNTQVLSEMAENRVKWFQKHTTKSIFEKQGLDVRIRNYINIVTATIPRYDKDGFEVPKSEIIDTFSKLVSSLGDFMPRKFPQEEYVSLMREILVPDAQDWNVHKDRHTVLNSQCADSDSILTIEEETSTLGLGKSISKEDFREKLKKDYSNTSLDDTPTNSDKDKKKSGILSSIKNIFFPEKAEKVDILDSREGFTKYHAKVLTTKLYPPTLNLFTMLNMFVDMYGHSIETEIPSNYFASLVIYFGDREREKERVSQETQWNLWQTQSLGGAARYFPAIRDRAQESEAINEMLNQNNIPMRAMWSLCIIDSNIVKVQKYSEKIKKKFSERKWDLQEEKIIPHWVFLYSLPLQFEDIILNHSKRFNTLFTANLAAITPIMTGDKGYGNPILNYIDRAGQVVGIDIFNSPTNYNFLVVGTSGSGKSYTMANFFNNYLQAGAKIRVIDVGRSYLHLCKLIGGKYIEFTEESNICLNFFTDIKVNQVTRTIENDEMDLIVPLIGLMAMQDLDPDTGGDSLDKSVLSGLISRAVNMAFAERERNAGMRDVLLALEKMESEIRQENIQPDPLLSKLITALYPYGHPDGEYFKYFNGRNNLNFTDNDFVVLELEELEKNKRLKPVVLAAVSKIIANEFFLGDRNQKKIIAIDEAWSLMDNKVILGFLEAMARRVRKYNGSSGIITQGIGDFFKNDATMAIFNSTANKIFLKQDSDSIEAAQKSGKLNFNPGIIKLMKTVDAKLPLFSEALIMQGESFVIVRNITDKSSHWIYTNNPNDVAKIEETKQRLGVSEIDARLIIGSAEENEITLQEEYENRLKEGTLISLLVKKDKENDLKNTSSTSDRKNKLLNL
jgi:type-IV secretion system protein TraC